MNARLLGKYFGTDRQWRGPCIVVVTAEATIQTSGSDSILHGGAKSYAPRLISGRVAADAACLLAEEQVLLLIQNLRIRQATGEDLTQRTLLVVNLAHVAAIEFPDLEPLAAFGVRPPPER
ncbi:MAG TPA: hypothetical protein VH120_21705 [Gemmataceae bacterium]|jgi:hypothetical protein|nr:hypothetical protein [Gemmataceae bacterium]